MRLSIYSNLKAKYPQETTLDAVVKAIQCSGRIQSLCEERRDLLSKGLINEAEIIKKKKIPAFCPGSFMFDGKGRANVLGLTNLCFLEADHIDEEQIANVVKNIKEDSHTVLCYRSVSGDGLHFIIKYEFCNIETPSYKNMGVKRMNHTYGVVFNTLMTYYQERLEITIDPAGANMERLSLMSADKDIYYNHNAIPFVLEYKKKDLRRKPLNCKFRTPDIQNEIEL